MITIHKYPVAAMIESKVTMPEGSKVIEFAEQDGKLFIWAALDTTADKTTRAFKVLGTGQEITNGIYIKTALTKEGFVWHLFEVVG